MKRIYATLTLLGLLATGAYAQRHCDIETVLVSPAEGTTLPCTGTFPIKYLFINHGPDAVLATDTLFGVDPELADPENNPPYFYTGSAIAAGDTLIGYEATSTLATTLALINAAGDDFEAPTFADGNHNYFAWFLGFSDTTVVNDTARGNNLALNGITINCGGTGIADAVKGLDRTSLHIYPNPGVTDVNFKYAFKAGNAAVRVTDIAGRVVLTQDFGKQTAGEKIMTVNVSSLTNGMYYLELVTDDQRAISKMVIRK